MLYAYCIFWLEMNLHFIWGWNSVKKAILLLLVVSYGADSSAQHYASVTCPAWLVVGEESTVRGAAERWGCRMKELHEAPTVLWYKKKKSSEKCVNPQVHQMKGYLNWNIKVPSLAISKQKGVQFQVHTAAHWQNMLIRSICFEDEK